MGLRYSALAYARFIIVFGTIAILIVLSSRSEAKDITDPEWERAVEATIQKYILAHPEVITDSLRAMELKRQESENTRRQSLVAVHQNDLIRDSASPVSGNPNGDVTIVEFFDYRCGFCKQVASVVTQLQKDDLNVRVVYKDFPILGELSVQASRAALAAWRQGKHQAFHQALLETRNELTRDVLFVIATQVGLDSELLERDMQSPDIQAIIDRNKFLGSELGISGTPSFIVGADLRVGALELKELKEQISKARGLDFSRKN